MTPIDSSFEKLLVLLVQAKVDFVTVGGIAVCLNGFIRLTEDVDILVDSEPRNLQRMLTALSEFGEGFARELSLEDFPAEEGAVRVIEAAENCQIDIFVQMRGNSLHDFRDDIRHFPSASGEKIPFLGPQSLILLKSNTVRSKDKIDVDELQRCL